MSCDAFFDMTPRWQVFSLLPSQKTNIMLKKIFYVASLALILSSCAKDVLSSDKEEITDSSFKPNFITRGLVQEEKEALMLELRYPLCWSKG